jgi:hypothetical protein
MTGIAYKTGTELFFGQRPLSSLTGKMPAERRNVFRTVRRFWQCRIFREGGQRRRLANSERSLVVVRRRRSRIVLVFVFDPIRVVIA